jgi:addiction module RelE/StbE family toxin
MIEIYPTSAFKKAYRKLPLNIKKKAERQEEIFLVNPFDKRLKTHKLKGRLIGYWSYSIDRNYRILFRFINKNKVIYYDIGTHEIYK